MSKIEQELLEAVPSFKAKKNEDRQDYLGRLMKAVSKLSDPDWAALTADAQNWNNEAAEAFKAGGTIEDFPDSGDAQQEPVEDEEELDPTDDNPIDDGDEEQQEEVVAAPKKRGRPAEKKEPKPQVRKVSACHTIKKMVVKKPTITVTEISEKLREDGLKVSDVTIATLRSDLRDTLRVLNECGAGNFSL